MKITLSDYKKALEARAKENKLKKEESEQEYLDAQDDYETERVDTIRKERGME